MKRAEKSNDNTTNTKYNISTVTADLFSQLNEVLNSAAEEESSISSASLFPGLSLGITNTPDVINTVRQEFAEHIRKLEEQNKNLTDALTDSANQITDLADKNNILTNENNELFSATNELVEQNTTLSKRLEVIPALEQQISVLTEKNATLTDQHKNLDSQNTLLSLQLQPLAATTESLRTAQNEASEEKKKNRELEKSLQESKQASEQARLQAEKEKQELVERNTILNHENVEKDKTIAEYERNLNSIIPQIQQGIASLKPQLEDGKWFKGLARALLSKFSLESEAIEKILNKDTTVAGAPPAPQSQEERNKKLGFNTEVTSSANAALERFRNLKNPPNATPVKTTTTTKPETALEKIARIRKEREEAAKGNASNNSTWQQKEDIRKSSSSTIEK